jgi:starch synthase
MPTTAGPLQTIPGVVIANPGAMRWMRPMATAFSDAGMLRAYVTPVAGGTASKRLATRLPGRLGAIPSAFLLRPPPARVPSDRVARAATLSELASSVALRAQLPVPVVERFNEIAAARFDRGVRAMLRGDDAALIGMTTTSALSFERGRSLGVRTLVDYPTVHHSWSDRLMAEEARLVPEYAFSIQTVAASAARRSRAERELALADRILVNSEFARRTFIESGVAEERLIAIPFGVELDQFTPATEPRRDGHRFRVLFAGQITQRKGLSYLLAGFEQADIPDSELVLLGRVVGQARPWSTQPGVVHHPPVPFYALPPVYRSADAFVLPSLFEGFPQTALQAMASGLPVIVSDHTFGEEVISDGVDGYVIPIRDATAIAERLRALAADPDLRRRIGAAARKRAEEFSWDRYGTRVVEAVRVLLEL